MDWSHYRFRSVWDLPGEPADVYAVLERAEDYPRWWPQVREARPLEGGGGTARFRSFLPYDLVVKAVERHHDPAAGILEIALWGDLEGWVRWTVWAHAGGTRVLFEQEVEVTRPLMRRLALVGRPLFRANHALMMRSGRRGLTALLKGA
ncbi:SRPBCC family protein [Streptomyces sp. NPDC058067]|uniref:SRPBCC family protein n=1 Tax=Streptomyces sp. NPDC058067 TaxID=3346324 RepID=UPI0036E1FAAE